jgi:integrase
VKLPLTHLFNGFIGVIMKTKSVKHRGIYKRGNVYWIVYAALDNKIIRESTQTANFKVAQQLLLKRRAAISEGKMPIVTKVRTKHYSFKMLADEYLVFIKRQKDHVKKSRLVSQLTNEFGDYQLRRFNTLMLEQFQTKRLTTGLMGKPNAPATVNRLMATIKHMLTKAVDWNMVETEISLQVHRAKQLQENNERTKFLSREECKDLINACELHLKPIVITALHTGMRLGEILNLEWENNIDLKHGLIILTDDMVKNATGRKIPIDETLKHTLIALPRRLDVPYVFFHNQTVNKKVIVRKYVTVRKPFVKACNKAKVSGLHFHDLRHTFASMLVMAGKDLKTVQYLLGHKSLTMVNRYAHLSPEHVANALSVLDEAIGM